MHLVYLFNPVCVCFLCLTDDRSEVFLFPVIICVRGMFGHVSLITSMAIPNVTVQLEQ